MQKGSSFCIMTQFLQHVRGMQLLGEEENPNSGTLFIGNAKIRTLLTGSNPPRSSVSLLLTYVVRTFDKKQSCYSTKKPARFCKRPNLITWIHSFVFQPSVLRKTFWGKIQKSAFASDIFSGEDPKSTKTKPPFLMTLKFRLPNLDDKFLESPS